MFVKPKKLWRKRFSKEEIEQIWKAFINASPLTEEEWEKTTLTKFMKKNHQIIHPETDKYDDTEGVQPQQMQSFLKKFSIEDFEKLATFFNRMAANKNPYLQGYMSDGYISWESIFNNIMPNYYANDSFKDINLVIGSLLLEYMDRSLARYQFAEDVVMAIGKDNSKLEVLKGAIKLGIVKGNQITMQHLDPKEFFETRKEVWKKVKKIIPQSEFMLMSNPNNFDTKLLPKIEEMFGSKQIAKLKKDDQFKVSLMINLFGINILSIENKKLMEIDRLANLNRYDMNVKDYRNILEKFYEKVNLSLQEIYTLISMFRDYPDIYEAFKKKDEIKKEDIDLYFYINQIVSYARNRNERNNLLSLDLYYWKVFQRYGVNAPEHIVALNNLYQNNKDKECSIPHVKGMVNKYEYEMLRKDNPLGMILGYATDCCQVVGNNGYSCLIAGYEREESTFFVVKKKNRIYAQSWVWEKTTNDGKKVLCFDSIEVLGKDLNKSKDILNAYLEAAESLVKNHGYDMVIAGADGNSIPEGIDLLGEIMDYEFIEENDLLLPFANVYTDANEEIVLIKEA